jgi:hypothetical protein
MSKRRAKPAAKKPVRRAVAAGPPVLAADMRRMIQAARRFAEVFPDRQIVSALMTQLGWAQFRPHDRRTSQSPGQSTMQERLTGRTHLA